MPLSQSQSKWGMINLNDYIEGFHFHLPNTPTDFMVDSLKKGKRISLYVMAHREHVLRAAVHKDFQPIEMD